MLIQKMSEWTEIASICDDLSRRYEDDGHSHCVEWVADHLHVTFLIHQIDGTSYWTDRFEGDTELVLKAYDTGWTLDDMVDGDVVIFLGTFY